MSIREDIAEPYQIGQAVEITFDENKPDCPWLGEVGRVTYAYGFNYQIQLKNGAYLPMLLPSERVIAIDEFDLE